mgnify:CR=1 FL=1
MNGLSPCCSHVVRTVGMVSWIVPFSSLRVPMIFLCTTSPHNALSARLFVGSTPGFRINVNQWSEPFLTLFISSGSRFFSFQPVVDPFDSSCFIAIYYLCLPYSFQYSFILSSQAFTYPSREVEDCGCAQV